MAAAYLARAGLSVLLLEKNDYIGGATTSQKVFPDYDAYLSRYSYLVSLVPGENHSRSRSESRAAPARDRIVHTLHEGWPPRRPAPEQCLGGGEPPIDLRADGKSTEFEQLQEILRFGAGFCRKSLGHDAGAARSEGRFPATLRCRRFAPRSLAQSGGRTARRAIERYLQNDLLRGLVFTDAKIGVFTHPHDESLLQNRCFLYHLIGNKTGEWKVPVGGMGACRARTGTGGAQRRRRDVYACRSSRARMSRVKRRPSI